MVELGRRLDINFPLVFNGETFIPISESRYALRFLLSANAFTSYMFELFASSFIVASRSIAERVTVSNSICLVLEMSIVFILAMGLLELLPDELVLSKLVVYVSRNQAVFAV